LEPLGITHILGRWKPRLIMKPIPQSLPVQNFSVLNPKYAAPNQLPWSLKEIEALQELFDHISVVSPANLERVKTELLNRSDIQILHFSGHGQYDSANADLNQLILEDSDMLDALGFLGTKLCAEACPVVYLNACSVGSAGLVVGRMGGFAANFLDSGCSGVIAPYWPINDRRAAKFSVSLYKKLKMGRAVGEALQELRNENPQDTTYRAYSYFGDPWARMNFSLLEDKTNGGLI
jgi:CHAT domain-containing protein